MVYFSVVCWVFELFDSSVAVWTLVSVDLLSKSDVKQQLSVILSLDDPGTVQQIPPSSELLAEPPPGAGAGQPWLPPPAEALAAPSRTVSPVNPAGNCGEVGGFWFSSASLPSLRFHVIDSVSQSQSFISAVVLLLLMDHLHKGPSMLCCS